MRNIYLFNIRFIDGNIDDVFKELDKGGVMVVPSAPVLSSSQNDENLLCALRNSSFAIFDSGYCCLCLLILKLIKVQKISGLKFLQEFVERANKFELNSLFSIDPSKNESNANKLLFYNHNYNLDSNHQYVAPLYKDNNVSDLILLNKIKLTKPKYILINIGGGIQEKLAIFISQNIQEYKPSIICTGAAIAFLTGKQTKIPKIIDMLYAGWLVRCFSNYKIYLPRYISSFNLIYYILKTKIVIK